MELLGTAGGGLSVLYLELGKGSSPSAGGSTPTGPPPLELGSPTATTDGTTSWVRFPVGGAGGTVQVGEVTVQVTDPNGRTLPSQPDWNLSMDSNTGDRLGIYSWSSGVWLVGGGATLSTEDSFLFSLDSTEAHQLVGDVFVFTIAEPGGHDAECSATIP